jgi:hypothetical protein
MTTASEVARILVDDGGAASGDGASSYVAITRPPRGAIWRSARARPQRRLRSALRALR